MLVIGERATNKVDFLAYCVTSLVAYKCFLCLYFQVYLSGDGKKKVNMFFKRQDYLQLSKLKIKVSMLELVHKRFQHL